MVAIMLGADNGFFYTSQVMHFSSPFTVFLIYHKQLGTFIWVLSNKKTEGRKGKVQLINATEMKSSMWKNMGKKNTEITPALRNEIIRIFMSMEESAVSKCCLTV